MSSFTRSELPSILFRGDGDLPRGQGILAEAAFLQEQVGGESLLVLEHEVGDLPFDLKAGRRTRFLFLKVGGSSTLSS